jgi:signal recognition particle subunit SRP54
VFANLTARLKQVADRFRGMGRLTEDNIRDAVRDVRRALIEADVALPVVKDLIARVEQRALGAEVDRSMTPGQAFVGILQQELTAALGGEASSLDLRRPAPVPILLAGLQGGGKTTTAAKLALYLRTRLKKKVMVVSLDVRRPAAIAQLEKLATQAQVMFAPASAEETPEAIAARAMDLARRLQAEVVIFDTAGRTRLDAELMAELTALQTQLSPAETLFVLDSMAGQDALNAASAFAVALTLTGIILTKTDGDARGGAALSARAVTGQPIKFIGTGEKLPALEEFAPDRMASRILGMGDVVGLVQELGQSLDRDHAEKLARKVTRGQGFDLLDLREQLQQMLGMGGLESLLAKLPLPAGLQPDKLASQVDLGAIRRQIGIINSMTPSERRFPKALNGSRKQRIAAGSGVGVPEVNRLLKQHEHMQKMMKRLSRGGLQRAMRAGLPGFPRGR